MASELKTDTFHFSGPKQGKLKYIVNVLFREFEKVVNSGTAQWRKTAAIQKIILYGSHARGTAVDDHVSGYYSDFDILVIVSQKRLTDEITFWSGADDQFIRDRLAGRLKNEVSLIVHTLQEINDGLKRGNYFFKDMRDEGIYLYDKKGTRPLAEFGPLDAQMRYDVCKKHFEKRFPSAITLYKTHETALSEGDKEIAAFLLHQTVEKLYGAFLLTHTNYLPPSHHIGWLRTLCEGYDRRLFEAWPRDTQKRRVPFNILIKAYVDARYSEHFTISEEQLTWLAECVKILQDLVEQSCREHLEKIKPA